MLVLNRHVYTPKNQESILIGDNIEIQIVAVRGRGVRVGIKAPPDVSILRKELLDRPQETVQEEEETAPPPVADAAYEVSLSTELTFS